MPVIGVEAALMRSQAECGDCTVEMDTNESETKMQSTR